MDRYEGKPIRYLCVYPHIFMVDTYGCKPIAQTKYVCVCMHVFSFMSDRYIDKSITSIGGDPICSNWEGEGERKKERKRI